LKGVFIDVETGGLDPNVHALTQVAAVAFEAGVEDVPVFIETCNIIVAPSKWLAVSTGALDLQHRTLMDLVCQGSDEVDVYLRLTGFLNKHIGDSINWVGNIWAQDAAFDHGFCRALEKRVGKGSNMFSDRCDWNCTKRLWTLLRGLGVHRDERTSLQNIMRHYDLQEEQTHDGLDDAMVSVMCLHHMLKDLEALYTRRD